MEAALPHIDKIIATLLNVWDQQRKDPFVSQIVAECFECMAKLQPSAQKVYAYVLPVVIQIMRTPDPSCPGILEVRLSFSFSLKKKKKKKKKNEKCANCSKMYRRLLMFSHQ